MFTSNTANVLKLSHKGSLEEGKEADVLVLEKKSLDIKHVFGRGRQFIKAGELIVKSIQTTQREES